MSSAKLMKTSIKNLVLPPTLGAVLGLVLAGQATAQTFTILHTFTTSYPNQTNNGGASPDSLILSGNTLYGTTFLGGTNGWNAGTVFAINTDGTGYRLLHDFFGAGLGQGRYPLGLLLSGNTLYGTAEQGGTNGAGTVFAINTDGTGFTNLYYFTGGSDGFTPDAGLLLASNTLYGTAYAGGNAHYGSVFAVNIDGTGFTNSYNFTSPSPFDNGTGFSCPILTGNTLYGTAWDQGIESAGSVFKINTDGTGFTNLYNFNSVPSFTGPSTPVEIEPLLILSGDNLFGTTTYGGYGTNDGGTVFAIKTDGTGFTNLYVFNNANTFGASPYALILAGNTLYGALGEGTSILGGGGTIFSLTLPAPQLTITASATNVIMTWPTNYGGFDDSGYTLQSTSNLAPASWSTVSNASVVVDGQNVVTNPMSGTQMFFRLNQ